MIEKTQYLQQIATHYSFMLRPEQMRLIGAIALAVLVAIVILNLVKKLRAPKKR